MNIRDTVCSVHMRINVVSFRLPGALEGHREMTGLLPLSNRDDRVPLPKIVYTKRSRLRPPFSYENVHEVRKLVSLKDTTTMTERSEFG